MKQKHSWSGEGLGGKAGYSEGKEKVLGEQAEKVLMRSGGSGQRRREDEL